MKAPLSISRRTLSGSAWLRFTGLVLTLTLLFAVFAEDSVGQTVKEFYQLNCTSCHRIGGGKLIGPDLKNVTDRKDREWLVEFIMDPKAKIDAGDEYALKMQKEANGLVMITVPIDLKRAEQLLDFIEAESKQETSEYGAPDSPEIPFTEADVAHGVELFTGATRLKSGAAPCMSCHSTNGSNVAMGGNLGPDLTQVFERLQGRAGLSAWLSAPPTPTMQAVFKPHPLEDDELHALVALFDNTANSSPESGGLMLWMGVIFYGLGGTLLVLLAFGGFWSGRFRAVRRPMVDGSKLKSTIANKDTARR